MADQSPRRPRDDPYDHGAAAPAGAIMLEGRRNASAGLYGHSRIRARRGVGTSETACHAKLWRGCGNERGRLGRLLRSTGEETMRGCVSARLPTTAHSRTRSGATKARNRFEIVCTSASDFSWPASLSGDRRGVTWRSFVHFRMMRRVGRKTSRTHCVRPALPRVSARSRRGTVDAPSTLRRVPARVSQGLLSGKSLRVPGEQRDCMRTCGLVRFVMPTLTADMSFHQVSESCESTAKRRFVFLEWTSGNPGSLLAKSHQVVYQPLQSTRVEHKL